MGSTIDAEAYYDQADIRRLLRISSRALGAAIRAGELRHTEIAGRRLYRGQWLIDWLEGTAQASSDRNADSVPA